MDTYEKVIGIMNEILNDDATKIDRNAELSEAIDSLMFIRLLIAIDKNFDVTINEADINYETFNSIDAIVKYIDANK